MPVGRTHRVAPVLGTFIGAIPAITPIGGDRTQGFPSAARHGPDLYGSLVPPDGGVLQAYAGSKITNDGTINNTGTYFDLQGTVVGTGSLNQSGGSTTVDIGATYTQSSLLIGAGDFEVWGQTTITGNVDNLAKIEVVESVLDIEGTYTQLGAGAITVLYGGTLDPPAIDIEGGSFGGSGTVEGPVTLSDSTLEVGDPTGALTLTGDYSQTGGEVDFEVDSNGNGGFLVSTLDFLAGSTVNNDGANIIFNFDNAGDEAAFGPLNLGTFFKDNSAGFEADFGGGLSGDTFKLEEGGAPVEMLALNTASGDLTSTSSSATPEPGSRFLLIPALGMLSFFARKKARGKI